MVRDPGLLASGHQQGGAVSELPTGTVTFLFTDLESSTRLWEQHTEAMREALARHDALLREAVETHRYACVLALAQRQDPLMSRPMFFRNSAHRHVLRAAAHT
jgi:class 3 adenylate cyclase